MDRPRNRRRAVLAQDARQDLQHILAWSRQNFGAAAHLRYRTLLLQALRDLEIDPVRIGSRAIADTPDAARIYHLQHSRKNVVGDQVSSPRHFVLYRLTPKALDIGRILHDSRNISIHLPADWLA